MSDVALSESFGAHMAIDRSDIARFMIPEGASLRDLISLVDREQAGIGIVSDAAGRPLATITDGDIRRGFLAGLNMDNLVGDLLRLRRGSNDAGLAPIVAPETASSQELLDLMRREKVRHVPLVNAEGIASGMALLSDLAFAPPPAGRAVVMAGGFGKRLHPITLDRPKPMLEVAGQPLIERLLRQLSASGVRQIDITTHYLKEQIIEHVGDGSKMGTQVRFHEETNPLGTAGALSMLDQDGDMPLVVVNSDIVTNLNFRAMLDYHQLQQAVMTVATRRYEVRIPYGVIREADGLITALDEKPIENYIVNAGIYVINPSVLSLIPRGQRYDMTDLINDLLSRQQRVAPFPIHEYWLDIGRPEDYQRAREEAAQFLPPDDGRQA